MNKTAYNNAINTIVAKEALIARHTATVKQAQKDLTEMMIKDKLTVFQGIKGIVTYQENTSNCTTYNLLKLFKKVKIRLFLKLIKFNATQAKPLIDSGELDSKIIDSIKGKESKTTPAKLKIKAL